MAQTTIDGHHDAVAEDNKHAPRYFENETWTFEHLQAFVMRMPVEQSGGSTVDVDVVVLFSNHCFSREVGVGEIVDEAYVVMDGSKRRVLDKQRYTLSRQYLPQLVRDLPCRLIRIADASRPNFVTIELQPEVPGSEVLHYAIFFEVKKDKARKRRMLLRIQSAYILEKPSRRLLNAEKMRFHVILKRAFA